MSAEGKLTDDKHLSGSNFPGWNNIHPFMTPLDVYMYVTNAREGKPNPFVDNIHVRVGTAFETPVIMELIPQYMPVVDVKTGFTTAYKHLYLPFSVSIDGMCRAEKITIKENEVVKTGGGDLFLDGVGIIETKITDKYCADHCPEHYKEQLFAQMECVPEATWGMVAIVKSAMMWIWVFRKEAKFKHYLEERVLHFEDCIKNNNPPDPINSIEVSKIHPKAEVESTILSEDTEEIIAQLQSLRSIKANVEKSIDDAEKVLKMQLGNAEVGFTKGYRVEWPTRTYKAKPEQTIYKEATPEKTIRLNTLKIRELDND